MTGWRLSQTTVGTIPAGTPNPIAAPGQTAGCGSGPNNSARLWTVTWDDQSWNPEVGFVGGDATWNQPPQTGVTVALQNCDRARSQALHSGTANVLLADGSVRGVSSGVSQPTWQIAVLPADGLTLGTDW